MLCLIATEAILFVYLIFTYAYLGAQSPGPWPSTGPPGLLLSGPDTIILLASSFVLLWGVRAFDRRRANGVLRIALVVTFLMGAVFIAVQGFEWRNKPFSFDASSYSAIYFTMTGIHMAHVAVGLVILAGAARLVADGPPWRAPSASDAGRPLLAFRGRRMARRFHHDLIGAAPLMSERPHDRAEVAHPAPNRPRVQVDGHRGSRPRSRGMVPAAQRVRSARLGACPGRLLARAAHACRDRRGGDRRGGSRGAGAGVSGEGMGADPRRRPWRSPFALTSGHGRTRFLGLAGLIVSCIFVYCCRLFAFRSMDGARMRRLTVASASASCAWRRPALAHGAGGAETADVSGSGRLIAAMLTVAVPAYLSV